MVQGAVVDRKCRDEAAAAASEQIADPASRHVVHVCGVQLVPAEFERKPGRRGGLIQAEPERQAFVQQRLLKPQIGVDVDAVRAARSLRRSSRVAPASSTAPFQGKTELPSRNSVVRAIPSSVPVGSVRCSRSLFRRLRKPKSRVLRGCQHTPKPAEGPTWSRSGRFAVSSIGPWRGMNLVSRQP
jgi:hypothetical protein